MARFENQPISSLLTPIHRLSPDVLAGIFALVHDDEIVPDLVRNFRATKGQSIPLITYPLPLSHVCGAWRNTVISHPLLWTHIYTFLPFGLEITRLFLERSEPCQINFYFLLTRQNFPSSPRDHRCSSGCQCTVINLLQEHLHRCGKIIIWADRNFRLMVDNSRALLQQHPPSLSNLQALHRAMPSDAPFNVPTLIRGLVFPLGVPTLPDVRFEKLLPCLYSQLRVLHVRLACFETLSEFCNLLSRCELLDTLALYHRYDAIPMFHPGSQGSILRDPIPEGALKLPSLSSLQLYNLPTLNISTILMAISTSAPKLHQLVIAPLQSLSSSSWDFEKGKFPSVKSLVLALGFDETLALPTDFAANCFPLLEEVLLFGMGWLPFIDITLRKNKVADSNVFWPKLHTLAITEPLNDPIQLLDAREAVGCPIRRLYVDQTTLQAQPELLRLNKDYLEIVERDLLHEICREGLYPENFSDFKHMSPGNRPVGGQILIYHDSDDDDSSDGYFDSGDDYDDYEDVDEEEPEFDGSEDEVFEDHEDGAEENESEVDELEENEFEAEDYEGENDGYDDADDVDGGDSGCGDSDSGGSGGDDPVSEVCDDYDSGGDDSGGGGSGDIDSCGGDSGDDNFGGDSGGDDFEGDYDDYDDSD